MVLCLPPFPAEASLLLTGFPISLSQAMYLYASQKWNFAAAAPVDAHHVPLRVAGVERRCSGSVTLLPVGDAASPGDR